MLLATAIISVCKAEDRSAHIAKEVTMDEALIVVTWVITQQVNVGNMLSLNITTRLSVNVLEVCLSEN